MIIEFSKLVEKNKELRLLLVGGGPDVSYFSKVANDLGISEFVRFTGMVHPHDVGYYYHIANLFVNFSMTETQGLTYIEALVSGLPLLVKYDDNLEGVIEEGYNGLSFTNDEEFIGKFNKIYEDKSLLEELSINSSKSVDKFSTKTYVSRILTIYNEALKKA